MLSMQAERNYKPRKFTDEFVEKSYRISMIYFGHNSDVGCCPKKRGACKGFIVTLRTIFQKKNSSSEN